MYTTNIGGASFKNNKYIFLHFITKCSGPSAIIKNGDGKISDLIIFENFKEEKSMFAKSTYLFIQRR